MSYLIKITDEQKELLSSMACVVNSNDVRYYHLPHWYRFLADNEAEMMDASEVPKEFHSFVFEEMIDLLIFIEKEGLISESVGGTGMYEEPKEKIIEMYLSSKNRIGLKT